MEKIKKKGKINSADKTPVFKSINKVNDFAEKIFNTVREPLLLLDKELRVVKASRSFYDFFKVTSNKTIGKLIYDLGNQQWNIPKLKELLEKILLEKTTFENYEVEHYFSKIGKRVMRLNARKIPRGLLEEQMILLAIEDITERKHKEESLSEKSRLTKEYLDILLNHAHVPMLIWDSSTVITRINHEFEKLSGYKWSEVRDKKIKFLFPKDKIESTLRLIKSTLFGKKMEVIEIDILTKDKSIKTVIWNSANIFDKNGKNIVATIAQDITKRKRAEVLLRESEEKYRSFFENSMDATLLTIPNGKILSANPAACRMFGYSEEEFFKLDVSSFVDMTDAQLSVLLSERALNGKAQGEITLIRKDRTRFPAEISSAVFRNQDGFDLGRACMIIRDVTDRKRAMEALSASEHLFHTLAQVSPVGIFKTNPDGYTTYVNSTWLQLSGLTIDKALGYGWLDAVHHDDREKLSKGWQESTRDQKASYSEYRFLHADGTIVWVMGQAIPETNFENQIIGYIGTITDITERKRTEEALTVLETRYRRLFESAKDGILILDAETGKIIDVNPFLIELLGYSYEKFIEKEIWEIGFFKDVAANKDKFLELQIKEYVRYEDLPLETADGRKINVEFISNVYIVNHHKVIQCNIRDITKRKHAEVALEENEKKYRELFNNAPVGYHELDLFGRITRINRTELNMLGYTEEEMIGQYIWKFVLDEDISRRRVLEKLKGDVSPSKGEEFYYRRKDLTIFPILVEELILRDALGKITGIRTTIQDITERKRAEEEITLLSQSLKSINECVSITDSQDNILFVNSSFLKTYGYNDNELIGKHMSIVRSPNNPPELAKEILPATLRGGWSGELLNIRKDGSEFPVYLSTSIINDEEDKPIVLIGVATDITERKRFEKELIIAKEKAEQSDKLKSEFLAQMSHEIRTPLSAIVGNVGYINNLFNERIDPDTSGCFDSIDLASKRIIRTIDLILNAAELQISSYIPQFAKVDLNSKILNKLYQEHQLSAKQKGLEIIYTCKEKDAKVIADEYCVTQIFANLIDNAIKYTKKGKVEILLEKNKTSNITVEVKDTGIGISKEFLPKIFELFAQEEQGYTRSFDGNGLGLAIVKRYCELNDIIIEVESEKNVGSTFRIIFNKEV